MSSGQATTNHMRIGEWPGRRFFQWDHRSVAHVAVGEDDGHVLLACGGPHPHRLMGHYVRKPEILLCGRCARVLSHGHA